MMMMIGKDSCVNPILVMRYHWNFRKVQCYYYFFFFSDTMLGKHMLAFFVSGGSTGSLSVVAT